MSIVYDIFVGNSSGGPVDYSTVVTTVSSLSVALSALATNTSTRFAVRARDTVSGYSDENTDAQVLIVVDAAGVDVTARPLPPEAVRAIPRAGATASIQWAYPYSSPQPIGFRVYGGIGTVNYGSALATVPFIAGSTTYKATISGLTDGSTYLIGVRSYSALAEEPNTNTVTLLADGTPPSNVWSLAVTATV